MSSLALLLCQFLIANTCLSNVRSGSRWNGLSHLLHVPAHDPSGCCSKMTTPQISWPGILWTVMAVSDRSMSDVIHKTASAGPRLAVRHRAAAKP
jgi:hypothetical protein